VLWYCQVILTSTDMWTVDLYSDQKSQRDRQQRSKTGGRSAPAPSVVDASHTADDNRLLLRIEKLLLLLKFNTYKVHYLLYLYRQQLGHQCGGLIHCSADSASAASLMLPIVHLVNICWHAPPAFNGHLLSSYSWDLR